MPAPGASPTRNFRYDELPNPSRAVSARGRVSYRLGMLLAVRRAVADASASPRRDVSAAALMAKWGVAEPEM